MAGELDPGPYVCDACGMDLTPTQEQIEALVLYGNPLRRAPCLKTESGNHVVSDEQLQRHREYHQREFERLTREEE